MFSLLYQLLLDIFLRIQKSAFGPCFFLFGTINIEKDEEKEHKDPKY